MEGKLWKWTNYWNGWQPRWFVLSENGVLSYYSSYDEVDQGCKGSMNVAACEIIVNQHDSTRLDVIVSHEKYMYLRAKDDRERQKWLVSLGSAKACVSKTNTHGRSRLSSISPVPVPLTSCTQGAISPANKNTSDNEKETTKTPQDALKKKRSELRLYSDLLMQQVHTIKTSVKDPSLPDSSCPVDLDKLNEGCSLLTQTCDTFIHTLDETMKLAHYQLNGTTSQLGTIISAKPNNQLVEATPAESSTMTTVKKLGRAVSFDDSSKSSLVTKASQQNKSVHTQRSKSHLDSSSISSPTNGFMDVFGDHQADANGRSDHNCESSLMQQGMEHTLKPSFPLSSENTGIDTRHFILASQGAMKVFDFLDPKTFAPIRSEVSGHISRIKTKFESNPMEFASLSDIVNVEINNNVAENKSSASSSLLWLVRYLMFIHEFLRRFAESDINTDTLIKDCLSCAYENCLREHHTPVIHNIFSIALESSPGPRTFLDSLGRINTYDNQSTSFTKELAWTKRADWRDLFQVNLLPSLGKYLDTMEKCLMLFMKFYKTTNLSEKN